MQCSNICGEGNYIFCSQHVTFNPIKATHWSVHTHTHTQILLMLTYVAAHWKQNVNTNDVKKNRGRENRGPLMMKRTCIVRPVHKYIKACHIILAVPFLKGSGPGSVQHNGSLCTWGWNALAKSTETGLETPQTGFMNKPWATPPATPCPLGLKSAAAAMTAETENQDMNPKWSSIITHHRCVSFFLTNK